MSIILVFDVPAESGGALTVLQEYHQRAVSDKKNKWIFIISLPNLSESDNVQVLRYTWVKKSWFHRLYFDFIVAPKLIERYYADEVISLQNTIIPKVKVPQTLLVHQAIPFCNIKFRITENFLLWVYQNIIGRFIIRSIKKASKVIVQTEWMKMACIDKAKIKAQKVSVQKQGISIDIKKQFIMTMDSLRTFFYPANGLYYKNHRLIIDAAIMLKDQGINNYKVIFTLEGNENNHIRTLYEKVKQNNLPVEFIGELSQNKVYDYYSRSVLVFPSYLETFGIPLLEGRLHNSPILASDCPFSHEVLDGYEQAEFFKIDDASALANLLENKMNLII